jgi:hypothetical protein
VPEDVEARARATCLALPEAYEEQAWAGTRWMVRKRTFAQVIGVENPASDLVIVLVFRSEGPSRRCFGVRGATRSIPVTATAANRLDLAFTKR